MNKIHTVRKSKFAGLHSTRAIAAIAALGVLSITSHAATYFVAPAGNDANAGTIARPWATLYRATYRALPGDTIYLRGGTYKYTVPQTIQGVGTKDSYLNVTAYPGETPILDFGLSTPGRDGLQLAGQYVNVSNLTVQYAPKANLAVWGASYINLKNIKSTGAYAAGILIGGGAPGAGHHVDVSNCEIWNCSRVNSKLNANQWQPALQLFQAANVTATNNNVHQNFGEGIGYCASTDSLIQNNTVWDNFSVNIYLDNIDKVDVKNNFVYNTGDSAYYRGGRGASGISLCVEGVPNPVGLQNSEISGNTVANCFAGIWYSGFGLGGGMKNVTIARNTLYKTTGGPLLWLDADKGHVGNTITGNIFQQAGGAAMSKVASFNGFTLGNNCWYGGNAGTSVMAGDLLSDPMLSKPGTYVKSDYMLKAGSPCSILGIGVDLGALAIRP